MPEFRFPTLKKIQLTAFSLFSQHPNIELEIDDGVLCLAGANGIGKSTFLAAVNFAITGCVPHPDRKFQSAAEYLRDAEKFSEDFFEGRIDEQDRDQASISVDFKLGGTIFSLTRGIFEGKGLRALKIESQDKNVTPKVDLSSPLDRDIEYRHQVSNLSGFASFEQFAFLQHFVFTFDESRHLLFWDKRPLEQILFLCFGGRPEDASNAEQLRRSEDRFDSQGRNLRFQATNMHKQIEVIEQAVSSDETSEADLDEQYKLLVEQLEQANRKFDIETAKHGDSIVKLAQESAAVAALRDAYQKTFAQHLQASSHIQTHPLISELLAERQCGVCGAIGQQVRDTVSDQLKGNKCPLCRTSISGKATNDTKPLNELKEIDQQLNTAKRNLEKLTALSIRLEKTVTQRRNDMEISEEALHNFEAENESAIDKLRGKRELDTFGGQRIDELKKEYDRIIRKSKEAYNNRDEIRAQLRKFQRELEKQYSEAEDNFVPMFRELAKLFLGIDLDIRMERRGSNYIALLVELRSTTRREFHQLSESQRFFVDIALRMALAKYMSSADAPASLFVDTPEGSLDISYESRAGQMFAKFCDDGHNILMTANINTSELLKKLAIQCGSKKMKLVRMTSWAELSDVQMEAEHLFTSAYKEIESALRG